MIHINYELNGNNNQYFTLIVIRYTKEIYKIFKNKLLNEVHLIKYWPSILKYDVHD